MKQKIGNLVCVLMFFSLMVILSVPLFAEGQENIEISPFAEADALRYSDIFGPLTTLDTPFTEFEPRYADLFGPLGISTRDMGFDSGEAHYTPITPAPRTTSSS